MNVILSINENNHDCIENPRIREQIFQLLRIHDQCFQFLRITNEKVRLRERR